MQNLKQTHTNMVKPDDNYILSTTYKQEVQI